MADIKLIIKTDKKVLSIPIRNLIEIDKFTIWYEDKFELINMLNNILDLNIINTSKLDIFLTYRLSEQFDIKYLPIKYKSDNYNYIDLKEQYAKYYKDDHLRIKTNRDGIRNVSHTAIQNYLNGYKDISNAEIDMAINSYFSGAGYKKYRDSYFTLKAANYKVKIDKLEVQKLTTDKTDLSKYEVANTYFSGLQGYAKTNEEAHSTVMDILAGYDPNELSKMVKNNNQGLFDGAGIEPKKDKKEIEHDEAMTLESITGKRLQELKELINDYYQSKKGKHR